MKSKLLFAILLLPLLMFSQKPLGYYIVYDDVPDSFKERYFAKEERNFFPMHVGDYWLYASYDNVTEEIRYSSYTVISDTVINGKTYYGKKYRNYNINYEYFEGYFYSNNENATLYVLDTADFNNNGVLNEDLLCDSLFVPYGITYNSYLETHFSPLPFEHTVYDSLWYIIDNDTLLTRIVGVDIYYSLFYTDKLGVTKIFLEGPTIYLLGAIIDSVQYGTIVDIEETETQPQGFVLYQNYPNPFNPTTTIKYMIPQINNVETLHATSLRIYNLLGEKVATLVNEKQSPGEYSVQFDASNLPSGVYFYTLRAGNYTATKKMILLK